MSQAAPPIDVGDLTEEGVDTTVLHDVETLIETVLPLAGEASFLRQFLRMTKELEEDIRMKASEEQANFTNRSSPLYNMYVKMTEEEDSKMTDRWQKDGDGILIFTGLFAAALAALLTVSVQDLRPNPQDTSAATFYLANIYQLLADLNVSRASILATPAQPPPFSPPRSAVWVNLLWFLSLAIALTCALLATMLQQWGRRFVTITHPPRYSQYNTAPIRAFFDNGVKKFHLRGSVEGLTALLHLSLFLFFSGLIVFLFNIDHTVFSWVASWVGLAGSVYGFITVMPIFWHDSPYYAPLSSSLWFFCNGTLYTFLEIRRLLLRLALFFNPSSSSRFRIDLPNLSDLPLFDPDRSRLRAYRISKNLSKACRRRISRGLTETVQETGSKLSPEINTRILIGTVNALDQEKEFEQFFAAVPRFWDVFHYSNTTPAELTAKLDLTMAEAFAVFLSRSFSLTSVSMDERVAICVMAADTIQLPHSTMNVLGSVFSLGNKDMLDYPLRISGNRDTGLCSQGIIAGVIASVSERDERWVALVKDQLGVSEAELLNYLSNGNSVLLANLIHITGPLFRLCLEDIPNMAYHLTNILSCISKFDIENTLPGLQHDFCALWNKIAQEARHRDSPEISSHILRPIRHLYIALHQDTDAAPTDFDGSTADTDLVLRDPSSYPLCHIPAHLSTDTDEIASESITRPPREPQSADHRRIHFAEESSLHEVPDTTPTGRTSLDPSTISPMSKSESDPRPTSAVSESTFTPHPPLITPSNKTTDPHNNALPPGWEVRHTPTGLNPPNPSPYVAPIAPAISREESQRVPDQFITDQVLPEAIQRPTAVVASSSRTAEGEGRSSTSQPLASVAATVTEGGMADTQSGGQPTTSIVRLDSSSAPLVDVASESVILPTTPPLGARHDSQEPNDTNELGSRHHEPRLDPSIPTWRKQVAPSDGLYDEGLKQMQCSTHYVGIFLKRLLPILSISRSYALAPVKYSPPEWVVVCVQLPAIT
ncbi:hypothetical protein BGW80DRAFT_1447786 [Lactifluus volemus]|nr:hypothetical protein BGW80DRAFT_1447786 [Lactifluus volemus]